MSAFKLGDGVQIISKKSKYYGYYGTVSCFIGIGYVGVKIDGIISKSKTDKYDAYYDQYSLKKIGEKDMAKLNDYKFVARVKHIKGYDTEKLYDFALYDNNIKPGDLVVVNMIDSPQICKVEEVINAEESKQNVCKAVIGKLYADPYLYNEEKKKEREKLRKEMDKKRKEIDAAHKDEYYANLDPEYKSMLEKMKELQA